MSSTDVVVICTIHEKHLKKWKYVLQIDVVPKKKADDKLKQRKKEGFTHGSESVLGGGKFPMIIVDADSVIRFEIEEALRPVIKFKEGQDQLKCSNIKKEEISRQIHLVPNECSSSDHAAITFYHKGEYLHQVTINNIPKRASDMTRQTSVKSLTTEDCGSAATTGYVEAVPIPPRHEPQPSEDDIESDNDYDRFSPTDSSYSSVIDNTDIPKALTDKSLDALSRALGPQDSKRLLVYLNVKDSVIKSELDNHPRDCGSAYANLFCKWRQQEIHRGEAYMRQEMNMGLEQIQRNDIRLVFMKYAAENADISPECFRDTC